MNNLIERIKKVILSEYFLLSIILIFGFLVRLYKIDNPIADWHSWRQADTASVTRTYKERGINLLYPRYHDISSIQTGIFNPLGYRFVEFPVYNAVHALLSRNSLFSLEMWGRLLSVFCALVSAFFIYLVGKRLMGKAGGLLSAFFFAFIPYNVYFSRVILPEPMGVAFVVISMWLFLLYIEKEKTLYLYFSGIFFALSMLIKPFMVFYSVPLIYLLVRKYGLKNLFLNAKLLIRFLIFTLLAIAPFFLWRVWVNQYPSGIPFFDWAFNGDKIRFRPSFWRWIFGERLGHLILGSWGLIPFSLGIFKKAKDFFTHLALLGMLLYVVIVATANVRHDYYQIITIPAVSLALASGSLYLWRGDGLNRFLSRTILIFSIFVMLITGALQVKEFYKINHPEIIEAGEALDRIAPKDALVVAPYNGDTAFLYQTKRWGWPAVDTSFDILIKRGARYFVTVNFADPDTKYVQEHFKVLVKADKYLIADLTKGAK